MAQIILQESAAPSTPATGNVSVYAKTDGKLYSKDDAGSESGFIGSVEIQSQSVTAFTTGGTSTAYTLTTSPVLSALTTNECYKVTFHTTSGATPTLARDGLTAKLLKQYDSAGAKVTASVATGKISDVVYDGTDYVVLDPATAEAGNIVQVVTASYSTSVSNSTSTYADSGLTATITPKFNNSKILVLVSQSCFKSSANTSNGVSIKLFRNAVDLGMIIYNVGYSNTLIENYSTPSTSYLDSPATTSATIYKTQFANQFNGASVNVQPDNLGVSTITLMEIKQ